MADIASAIDKMNDVEIAADAPLSEALLEKIGANINGLIDRGLKFDEFTANGNWTAPEGVTEVLLIGCGGGGGGGGAPPSGGVSGGFGGNGAPLGIRRLTVIPGNTYSVTIGAGGAGGGISTNGQTGTPSVFGSVTFLGGRGGSSGFGASSPFIHDAGANGGGPSEQGGRSGSYDGGASTSGTLSSATLTLCGHRISTQASIYGGGGGAGPFGNGANGASVFGVPGQSAAANTGAGGGGGSSLNNAASETGGAGGSGRILVCYVG